MKIVYYMRRMFSTLRTQGVWPTLQLAGKYVRFRLMSYSGYRKRYRIQRDLRSLPDVLPISEVWSVACAIGDGMISPMQDSAEFKGLLQHVFGKGGVMRVLEIGSCGGGSLFCFCRLAEPQATLISVDLPGGFFGGGAASWKIPIFNSFVRRGQTLHLLRRDSHDEKTLARVRALLDGQALDFLMIDGDHTFEGVKQDYEMYAPLVREGGYIAFHDTLHDASTETKDISYKIEVGRFWKSICGGYPHWNFDQSGKIGIGLLQKTRAGANTCQP